MKFGYLMPLSALLISLSATAAQPAPFTPQQEQRIRELIHETLVKNPAILAEAADAMDRQAETQRNAELTQFIAKNQHSLFNDPDSPRLGAAKPRLTIVSFTDYNCPYCKQFDPVLEKVVSRYPDVALVIKLLPFRSESSLSSARLALTQWRQDKKPFWELHRLLMMKKGYHDDASIQRAAAKAGVTHTQSDAHSMETIKENLRLADGLGVQGTPATLIGNNMVPGAISEQALNDAIRQALAAEKS
ncbi:metal resistance protein [Salmonella enterica subsp. enterica serovar Choleraesuis]|nr:metal resistance protein [Salmonella enterica subsp. enterica serovar Choleraesuis]